MTERRGLLLRLDHPDGVSGWGEISPLEGYSPDCLEDVYAYGKNSRKPLPPSLRFAAETALIRLYEAVTGAIFAGLPVPDPETEVPVNALLLGRQTQDPELLADVMRRLADNGFTTVKMKVGQGGVENDIACVRRVLDINDELSSPLALRLDANGAWRFEDAVFFARGVDVGRIEYIEEPLRDMEAVTRFFKKTGLPCAMDESLRSYTGALEAFPEGVRALVLKPSVLGGVSRCLDFIGAARNNGMTAVISSCYEAGPGFPMLMRLAALCHQPETAHGLDTLKYLDWSNFLLSL